VAVAIAAVAAVAAVVAAVAGKANRRSPQRGRTKKARLTTGPFSLVSSIESLTGVG